MKLTQKILNLLVILFVFNSKGSERTEKIIKAIIGGKPGNEIVSLMKNVTVDELNRQACRGKLALVCASGERNYEAMEALLKAGADVNLADVEGHTPLQELLSSYQGLDERPQLELLLNYGADWSAIDYEGLRPGLKKLFQDYAKKQSKQQREEKTHEDIEFQLNVPPFHGDESTLYVQAHLKKIKDGTHALRVELDQLKTDTVELHKQTTSDTDATKEQVREVSDRLVHALRVAEQERDNKQSELDQAHQEIEWLSSTRRNESSSPSITYNINQDHSQNYTNEDNRQCCSNIWCKLLCCFKCCRRCEQPCRESKWQGCSLCSP